MFIKRLEIYGFKSFPYKISIPFSPGITAIVGPNGAGKSNIIDAIRWVLGEQSLKKLRIKELSELIFSGNSQKKIDFTEVKLIINHDPPIWEKYKDLNEIVIVRRFYKNGESEFYINHKPCRLKDIQFLFLNLGISPQSYGIIEQGKINKFLELSPKELKLFLEDLAGVSSFRITEEETEKNIQKTKENLVRLNDILYEIKTQYEHLRKQAEEARKYLSLKERLKNLSIRKYSLLSKITLDEIKKLKDVKNNLEIQKSEITQKIEEIENQERMLYQELIPLEREIKDIKEDLVAKENNLKLIKNKFLNLLGEENEIAHRLEKEKIKKETEYNQLIKIQKENEYIEKTKEELENKIVKLKKELKEYQIKEKELKEIHRSFIQTFEKLEKEILIFSAEKEKFLEEKKEIEKNLHTLAKKKESYKKDYIQIFEELKKLKKDEKIWQDLIEKKNEEINVLIKQKEEKEKRLELFNKDLSTLKDEKQKILAEIKSLRDRLSLIKKFLAKEEKGLSKQKKLNFKTLGEILLLNKKELSILEFALKDFLKAFVIEDLSEIEKLINLVSDNLILYLKSKPDFNEFFIDKKKKISSDLLNYKKFVYIPKDKVLITPYGFIFIIKKPKKGIFTLKKEKEELLNLKDYREKELKSISEKENEILEIIEKLKIKIQSEDKEIKNLKKELNNLQSEKEKFNISFVRLEEKLANLEDKITFIEAEIKELNSRYFILEEKLKNLKDLEEKKRRKYNKIKEEKFFIEEKINILNEKINKIKTQLAKYETQNEDFEKRKSFLQKEIQKIKNTLKNLEFSQEVLTNQLSYIKNKIKKTKKQKDLLEDEVTKLKEKLESLIKRRDEIELMLNQYNKEKRRLEKEIHDLENKQYGLEIELVEKNLYLENLFKELKNLDENIELKDIEKDILENINIKELEKEIEIIKNTLKNFQEVNLASIKEFKIIKERYQELRNQKEDLEKSIKELNKILDQVRKYSREKILESLKLVNEKLKVIFSEVFNGGYAEFKLIGEDPLSAGLEFFIHVPGKNIKHLNMLSGGEKSLCTLAILITFYLIKPGPFCILDEVDAHLDEKNSLQFIKLLKLIKKNSQIILITHNPYIMKEVDSLIGVTMEEKGISKIVNIKINNYFNEYKYLKEKKERN